MIAPEVIAMSITLYAFVPIFLVAVLALSLFCLGFGFVVSSLFCKPKEKNT